jgi:hypothetical protein
MIIRIKTFRLVVGSHSQSHYPWPSSAVEASPAPKAVCIFPIDADESPLGGGETTFLCLGGREQEGKTTNVMVRSLHELHALHEHTHPHMVRSCACTTCTI